MGDVSSVLHACSHALACTASGPNCTCCLAACSAMPPLGLAEERLSQTRFSVYLALKWLLCKELCAPCTRKPGHS